MRVFYAGNPFATISLSVAPAADPDGVKGGIASEWLDDEGNPRNIGVQFTNGAAIVADALGKYLLARKLAQRTQLIIPHGVAA